MKSNKIDNILDIILEADNFDKSGLYIITTADGKKVKESNVKSVLSKPGEFLYTKFNGETITIGQDEDEKGKYFVSGKKPSSFKEFKDFESAFNYWKKTYRKEWKK